ncbi:ribose-5-phosphate isomerase RpiA [Chlamydiifrater phoenicopteri]|uniref:ribose-5-phosphate isomerase RpiA n=1 Tax=Chlamydiifrater phoenicopteri TaxID=2681469 RepID=UPI001BCEEF2D|nr:ribose-5-phosphate isomerase RpiA [Chlamydiifrater phoenicopteri]
MVLDSNKQSELKRILAKKAAQEVVSGMFVGLGTGSTASLFINELAKRVHDEGIKVDAVASSVSSARLATQLGIRLLADFDYPLLDLTVDGADEVDPFCQLIKGGGGAMTREKIVMSSSRRTIILIDETKEVDVLGAFGVPVEILLFGANSTVRRLNEMGYSGCFRKKNNEIVFSDNGNPIFDISYPKQFFDPSEDISKILSIPGVVEVGLIVGGYYDVWVGSSDGSVRKKISQKKGKE